MVGIALRRPYTFIVMAMLILLATPFVLAKMAMDIFPEINIPVISVIWNYNGLPAQEMGQRIAASSERGLTTTVSDIEHIESTSLASSTVIKIFFQSTANIQTAIAQVVAAMQPQVRQLPPGITPPLILNYNAATVPILQLALSGHRLVTYGATNSLPSGAIPSPRTSPRWNDPPNERIRINSGQSSLFGSSGCHSSLNSLMPVIGSPKGLTTM